MRETLRKSERNNKKLMFPGTMFVILILTLISCLVPLTTGHGLPCSPSFQQLIMKRNMTKCKKMTTLGVEFAWQINDQNESKINIVFGARLDSRAMWLAWGVNPSKKPMMVGTRAIIGIRQPRGGSFNVSTYNITSDTKRGCELQPSEIEVGVGNIKAEYIKNEGYLAIEATLALPPENYNITRLNHVWQVGYRANNMEPKMHLKALLNVDSTETINLRTGKRVHVKLHRHYIIVHGILNIVGWGMLLPTGAIIARYFKYPLVRFKKWWFVLHVSCQLAGYTLGTAGWIVGLCLGRASRYYSFSIHGLFAIFIFTIATLQMLALRLKPYKRDEFRKYWNMYHHFLGYALLAVILANIFKGIYILRPDNKTWKWFYVGVLGLFGAIVVVLEIYTWAKFKMDKKEPTDFDSKAEQDAAAMQSSPSPAAAPTN